MAEIKYPPDERKFRTILNPLSTGGRYDWFCSIELNGVPVEELIEGPITLTKMTLWSEEHGSLFYGKGEEGYDRILYREKGGVVTILWTIIDGILYIGFIKEFRSNAHGTFLFALGGMVGTKQKTCCSAMKDKAAEKAGIDVSGAVELPGCRGMFNRLIQEGNPLDPKDGLEKFYGLEIDPMYLKYSVEQEGYILKSGCVQSPKSGDLVFLPWTQVTKNSPDLIGIAALMRLLAHLSEEGVIEINIKNK